MEIVNAIRVRLTRDSLRYYLEERIHFPLHRRELLFRERRLSPSDAAVESVIGRYQLRWISGSELTGMEFPGGFITKERALQWLSKKPCKLAGVFDGGRLVGSCWLEMQYVDLDFLDVRCPLAGSDVYVSKLAILPGQRFGLGRALMQAAIAEAARQGRRRIIGAHVPENAKVQAIYAAQDWTCYQRVSYVRAGFLRRYIITRESDGKRSTYYSAGKAAEAIPNLFSAV